MAGTPTEISASSPPEELLATPPSVTHPSSPRTPISLVSPIAASATRHSASSMASIALSESSLDYDHLAVERRDDVRTTPRAASRHVRKPSSLEILQNVWAEPHRQSTLFDTTKDLPPDTPGEEPVGHRQMSVYLEQTTTVGTHGHSSLITSLGPHRRSLGARSGSSSVYSDATPRRISGSESSEDEQAQVDWQRLDEHEEHEKEDKDLSPGAEDESTAFLLARLEQENAKFSSDPKSAAVKSNVQRARAGSRPPSMGLLKKLVSNPNAPSARYSIVSAMSLPEEPPPLTELEFWAALVQDYPSTAARLPTLTTTKVRAGIPPPLRGVVWTSMAGARDRSLEEAYEKLLGEKSPYEGIINKDVGRSFPGVELFMDAEGEGQKMLGRVLKCFSLHDKDIGYCQGLGFLVGPLLMNMGERDAFCVLVRLMDHYSLRPSFLPSLSGLHMRIYQFSTLLKQHRSKLAEHLTSLGVEPAYLSQWFLSCFAVTCPLPMLFRIYDVIFAEGANETVMRVALALMRRNEERMLAAGEFEEVMQLLLGRGIWDCYAVNADDLVDDFTSLGDIVTHARLEELEKEFETQSSETVGQSAGFLPDVQAAAGRFLGRLWSPAGNHAHNSSKSASTLSPNRVEKDGQSGHARSGSCLHRSASKQSINTINDSTSSEASTSSTTSSASTAPTEIDTARESTADTFSLKSKSESVAQTSGLSKEERSMHEQIEGLLTAMSEMQREQAQLATMLQQEREEKAEDHRFVMLLVRKLKEDNHDERAIEAAEKRRTLPVPPKAAASGETKIRPRPKSVYIQGIDQQKMELDELVEKVNERLQTNKRISASFETKAQLRNNVARVREQLAIAEAQSRDLAARLEVAETSLAAFTSESDDLRTEVKELRDRVNEEFKARQKLEHQLRDLKAEARSIERKDRERVQRAESSSEVPRVVRRNSVVDVRPRTGSVSSAPLPATASSGLKELKLGRRDSTSSVQSMSALRRQTVHFGRPEIQIENAQPIMPQTGSAANDFPSPVAFMAPASFGARSSSLATQEVFATPEHEVVPEEALLLELVNAKTAEAQARQEVDELKRGLMLANRRYDAATQALQAQIAAAQAETQKAVAEAHAAREAAEGVRSEAAAHLLALSQGLSLPTTPAAYDSDAKSIGMSSEVSTPALEKKIDIPTAAVAPISADEKKKTAGSPASAGGWFWSRRTGSTVKASMTPPAVEER